ncbi:hypothetical protein FA13DRAFT_381324 [Coprinellus micaceus]|uniref:DUF6534 domain-containing protein n=1 Tax=Coprinellus micaceus TaxID=71717 RepID=A0A4Y7SCE5_COPMI|nr:hypothetical protein FA13DRAFT_381324 [Coprinellus micaceus]
MPTTLDNTFGALQIGVLIAVYLFGIVTLQCNIYASRFPDDRKIFKCLVVVVWLLELAHTISITYETYTATITYFGHPELYTQFAGFGVAMLTGGMLTMLVQSFFAWRLWTILFHPWRYIGLAAAILAVLRFAVSIFAGVEAIRTTSITTFAHRYRAMLASLLSVGAAIDVLIAVAMLSFLFTRKKKALDRVARLLDRLVGYTVRTGFVTSVAAVAIVILFLVSTNTFVWLAMYTFLAKLYSNSLLSALNARSGLRETVGGTDASGSNSKSQQGRHAGLMYRNNPAGAISIQMKTTTEMEVDGVAAYTVPKFRPNESGVDESDDISKDSSPDLQKSNSFIYPGQAV